MERNKSLGRQRRQLGIDASGKKNLARHIASLVALSLSRNRCIYSQERRSGGGKQGLLASTLRLAERNVSDMTRYLQRQEAHATTVASSRGQTMEVTSDGADGTMCVICWEESIATVTDMKEKKMEVLPCGHVFHTHCIAQWLQCRRTCPVDRRPVD